MTRARILADYVAGGTTAAEFDYMDGVTSNVQTQIDAKAPTAGPTFTGTVAIPNVANLETAVVANTAKVTNSTNASDLASGTIADARMPNLTGAITTVEGAVATTIANDAVDSQHYAAGSIDNEHLADDAVGSDELANDVTISTSGTITSSAGITETGGVLKENLLTNSGFDVWSNSTQKEEEVVQQGQLALMIGQFKMEEHGLFKLSMLCLVLILQLIQLYQLIREYLLIQQLL